MVIPMKTTLNIDGNLHAASDLSTAVLMREHGVGRICTRDAGFTGFRS